MPPLFAGTSTREATAIRPLPNAYVEDLHFLDNVTRRKRDISKDQFWKHVVLVSDSGRRLAIYSCYTWECVAKLRVETSSDAGRLDVSLDPTARYIYLLDYDSSVSAVSTGYIGRALSTLAHLLQDMFCVELTPDFPRTSPHFIACAQISFSSKLVCVSPCKLEERSEQGEPTPRIAIDDHAGACV